MAMASTVDVVIRAGFLDKSPPLHKAGSSFKGYKRRWFVLRNDSTSFNYYESSNTKKRPKGTINMTEVVKIEGYQTWPGSSKSRHPWVFTIETLSGRVYHLSAASEESMQSWVAKLQETFQFFLLTNNTEESKQAAQALQNYSNGVIPVNVALISTASVTASVQVDERTTAREVVALACRRIGAAGNPATYGLVLVDASMSTCERVEEEERPLDVLRRHPTHRIYALQRDELPFALKLIKGTSAPGANSEESGSHLFDVKFLGCRTITHDTDDDGAGDTGADISRQDLQAMGEALRRSGAATADSLSLSVSHDGIKVLKKRKHANKPYMVLLEHPFLHITDCIDMDKLFVYSLSMNAISTPKTMVYVFKCSDAKATTKLRFLFRSHCQAAHHACVGRIAEHSGVPSAPAPPTAATGSDSLEFNSLWMAQTAARRRQSSRLRADAGVPATGSLRVLLSALGEDTGSTANVASVVARHQRLLDSVLARDEEA